MSYTWRSTLKGIAVLKDGMVWRIGDGYGIDMWMDPWLPNEHRKPITPKGNSLLRYVSDLINPVTGDWDIQLVQDTFWDDDVRAILALPVNTAKFFGVAL
jgi:hypothetical protein